MSRYRIAYTDRAREALTKMTADRRTRFLQEIAKVADNPHAYGRSVDRMHDRRRAVIAGAMTDYRISEGVLTVTVVGIVHTD